MIHGILLLVDQNSFRYQSWWSSRFNLSTPLIVIPFFSSREVVVLRDIYRLGHFVKYVYKFISRDFCFFFVSLKNHLNVSFSKWKICSRARRWRWRWRRGALFFLYSNESRGARPKRLVASGYSSTSHDICRQRMPWESAFSIFHTC